MRYFPHSDRETRTMLDLIGVEKLDELFSGISDNRRLRQSVRHLAPCPRLPVVDGTTRLKKSDGTRRA